MRSLKAIAITLIAVFIVSSCSKEETIFDDSYDQSSALKKAPVEIPIYTDVDDDTWPVDDACVSPVVYDLYGGQTILLGTVSIIPVSIEEENYLYVKYELNQESKDAGCKIIETHLYAGTLAALLDKNGSPKIGHFPYAWEDKAGSTVVIMVIPDDVECEDVIAAHAVVNCNGDEETAWAKSGEPVFALKSRMEVSEGSYIWSIAGAVPGTWCSNFMYLPLIENLDPTLQPLELVYYNDGETKFGEVLVELDEDENVVRFTINSDNVDGGVDDSHLFLGSVAYLNSIGICDHYSFPFQNNDPEEEHVFEFPASILLGGGEFEGPRWGFYVHYCSPC